METLVNTTFDVLSLMDEYLPTVVNTVSSVLFSIPVIVGICLAYLSFVFFIGFKKKTLIRVPLDDQSKIIRKEGDSDVRVSKLTRDSLPNSKEPAIIDEIKTLYDCFRRGLNVNGFARCLGTRNGNKYDWIDYRDAYKRCTNFGCGLVSLGLKASNSTFVGIYCPNRPEWCLTEHACYKHSMVLVPLYDTLGADACHFIINQANISTVIVDADTKANMLMENIPRCLKKIISVSKLNDATTAKAKSLGISTHTFAEVEELGKQNPVEDTPPKESDIGTISYTSGTTGNPKGAVLSHANVVAGMKAVFDQLEQVIFCSTDVLISYLPLAHLVQRISELAIITVGGSIGYFSGDPRTAIEDIRVLKPTFLPAVPRIFNKIYDEVMGRVNHGPPLKRFLFHWGLRSKLADLKKGIISRSTIWDRLVFRKVQSFVGGRLRISFVGAAPISGDVLNFMRVAFGADIMEVYGQTEVSGPACMTVVGDWNTDQVGPPMTGNEIKLGDVPEMDYYAKENKGEIMLKGKLVFQGYYRDKDNTKAALDDDGWLHTGDIGMWLPNGTLKVIDRKKNIFKLSQGEYVAPEKLENVCTKSNYIDQMYIHGDSLQSSLVGVVIPELDSAKRWALQNDIDKDDLQSLCKEKKLKEFIQKEIDRLQKESKVKGFEKVTRVHLHHEPFTIANGLVTPTMKMKRSTIANRFKTEIDQMYSTLQ